MSIKLKYIDLQGWQSWKKGRIPLSPFTILVGLSRSGKTSIFRAAQFLLTGEWDPTFPTDPKQATAVGFQFENGTRVIRLRKESQNQAAIIKDGDTTKYKSFGATIPGIQSLINIKPIEVGAKSINLNFSLQDDPPFMVSEPRPVKAQLIGRLYGAHIINQMLREMSKDKKNTEAKRRDSEERLKKLEEESHAYDTIEEQETILKEATRLVDSYTYAKECKISLSMFNAIKDSFERDKWVVDVDTKGVKKYLKQLAALRLLKDDIDSYIILKKELKSQSKIIKLDTKSLKRDVVTLGELVQIKEDLGNIYAIGIRQAVARASAAAELKDVRSALDNAIITGDSCPVCGGPVAKDHGRILENVSRLIGGKMND